MATTTKLNAELGHFKRDALVYIILLLLASLQFILAFQRMSVRQMFVSMFIVAIVEAGLAVLYLMHLSGNRGLKWFVLIFAISAIVGMQFGWTDSYRQLVGVPWAH